MSSYEGCCLLLGDKSCKVGAVPEIFVIALVTSRLLQLPLVYREHVSLSAKTPK